MQFVEAHGVRIPMIGLGTMTLKGDVCVQAVKTALQMGYRHLDTAAFYGNEVENGEGMRQSGVKREDIFLCTKVRQEHLRPADFVKVIDQSLANLKLPYVDLLLIHWNNKDIPFKESIGALCQAKKDGKTKHVGVANFTTQDAGRGLGGDAASRWCATRSRCTRSSIRTRCSPPARSTAWRWSLMCPIARGKVPGAEVLERIGKAHGKSAAQVSLRYLVQLGCCSIPRTATPAHLKENLDVFDFKLSDAEMAELKTLNATNMRVVNPPHAPVWDTP